MTIDGLDVVKSVEQASRAATNWLLNVKKESFIKMVQCDGEYLKYNARSNHDQVTRDKSRIKQLSKFAKTYFKNNTVSGRIQSFNKTQNRNNSNNKVVEVAKIDEMKESIILISDWVDESAYSGLENVYSLSKFKETFALT